MLAKLNRRDKTELADSNSKSAPGMFCIFYPGEGHKPCCSTIEPQRVKKAVFKVAVA
ncbi:MAG: DUF386 family protein [Balneolaceae bacterium]|nr:MAG: DUF386 family protein [Balneolaceae bacterium]